jgi:glycosyltransferase involved in cell wall biosynthesis
MGEFAREPRLHLVGLVEDVASVVAGFDVFLLSSRYEGLPRVVVEAMALEKPVVSTPADGVVEVVKDGMTGRIVPHGDAQALADAALALIRSPDRGRSMGRAARVVALSRFDLDSMVSRTEVLYDSLLAEKGLIPAFSPSPKGGADRRTSSRDR